MAKKRNKVETHVHITPAGLEALATQIWGKEWRAKFSEVLGVSYSQLHRYMTVYNGQTVPQAIVVALEALRLLTTGPTNDTLVSIAHYRAPIADALPVKFVAEKKPERAKAIDSTPVADFFGGDDEAAEIVPETPVAPPMAEPEPVAKKRAAPKRKMPTPAPVTPPKKKSAKKAA
jgi:hypothetical protein